MLEISIHPKYKGGIALWNPKIWMEATQFTTVGTTILVAPSFTLQIQDQGMSREERA
jgi:hypothetical protein